VSAQTVDFNISSNPTSPVSIPPGGTVSITSKLTWNTSSHYEYCDASGDWSGRKMTNGEETVTITTDHSLEFRLVCFFNFSVTGFSGATQRYAGVVVTTNAGGGNPTTGGGNPTTGGGNPTTGGGTNPPVNIPFKIDNPFKYGNSLFELLRAIINNILMPIGGVLAVLAFIYSGFLYVTAQGNMEKIKTAHKALLYTAIGTAVLLGSWVIANAICNTIQQLGGPLCS
jgi:hypothetical protein